MYLCRNCLSDHILSLCSKLPPQRLTLYWCYQHIFWRNLAHVPWLMTNLIKKRYKKRHHCQQNSTSSHVLEVRGSAEAPMLLSREDETATVPSISEEKSKGSILSGFSSRRMAAITDNTLSDCKTVIAKGQLDYITVRLAVGTPFH